MVINPLCVPWELDRGAKAIRARALLYGNGRYESPPGPTQC